MKCLGLAAIAVLSLLGAPRAQASYFAPEIKAGQAPHAVGVRFERRHAAHRHRYVAQAPRRHLARVPHRFAMRANVSLAHKFMSRRDRNRHIAHYRPFVSTRGSPQIKPTAGTAVASWYGVESAAYRLRSAFDAGALTAAHRTLPSERTCAYAPITRRIVVRINDADHSSGRDIDLFSQGAAHTCWASGVSLVHSRLWHHHVGDLSSQHEKLDLVESMSGATLHWQDMRSIESTIFSATTHIIRPAIDPRRGRGTAATRGHALSCFRLKSALRSVAIRQ